MRQGTLALMVSKTLEVLGPQHGYGIAKRIEQTSDNLLAINQDTLYRYCSNLSDFFLVRSSGSRPDRQSHLHDPAKGGGEDR